MNCICELCSLINIIIKFLLNPVSCIYILIYVGTYHWSIKGGILAGTENFSRGHGQSMIPMYRVGQKHRTFSKALPSFHFLLNSNETQQIFKLNPY